MDTIDLSRFPWKVGPRLLPAVAVVSEARVPPDSQRPAPTLSLRLCRRIRCCLWSRKYNVLRDRSRVKRSTFRM